MINDFKLAYKRVNEQNISFQMVMGFLVNFYQNRKNFTNVLFFKCSNA